MKQYGNGSVYQRSDGKWVAAIFVKGNKRVKYPTSNTEKAARALIRALWQDVGREEEQVRHAATDAARTIPTVAAFVEDWLAAETLKPTTVESYRNNLKAHVVPVIGTQRLDEVTSADVASLVASVLKSGASQRTAQYAYSLVRRLLQVACDWEIISANPGARVKRPRVEREEKQVWTKDEAEAFILYARQGRAAWDGLFLVALLSSLRLGELLGLEWQDVDWQEGTISVKRNLVELQGGVFRLQTPKSKASIRTIALPSDALQALRERLEAAPLQSGPIFRRHDTAPRSNGIGPKPIPRRNAIREAFRDSCRRAGVP